MYCMFATEVDVPVNTMHMTSTTGVYIHRYTYTTVLLLCLVVNIVTANYRIVMNTYSEYCFVANQWGDYS